MKCLCCAICAIYSDDLLSTPKAYCKNTLYNTEFSYLLYSDQTTYQVYVWLIEIPILQATNVTTLRAVRAT